MQQAVIANEDHNFYYHHGVDFGGIMRAGVADLTHQEFQGASTITQQLARKLFLNDQVSISRKIQEALLAIEIERYYTKDEILERYLNIVYLGSGAYGVDAAAHTYFGESVDKLSVAQAAMIAGVIAAPSDYSPFVNLALAKDRQHHVLDRMVESGYITQAQANAAANAPARPHQGTRTGTARLPLSLLHDLRYRATREALRQTSRRRGWAAGVHDARSADARRSAGIH